MINHWILVYRILQTDPHPASFRPMETFEYLLWFFFVAFDLVRWPFLSVTRDMCPDKGIGWRHILSFECVERTPSVNAVESHVPHQWDLRTVYGCLRHNIGQGRNQFLVSPPYSATTTINKHCFQHCQRLQH